jgi:hypothetical protein
VWRGDGSSPEPGRAPRPADLPPGAVVAEFDHDDPAYQAPVRAAGAEPAGAQVRAQAAPAGCAEADDDAPEDDEGCCGPSAPRREAAGVPERRPAPDQGPSVHTGSDAPRLAAPLEQAFDVGRHGNASIVSAAPQTPAVNLSLPAQSGHDMDVLDPAEAAADPWEAR